MNMNVSMNTAAVSAAAAAACTERQSTGLSGGNSSLVTSNQPPSSPVGSINGSGSLSSGSGSGSVSSSSAFVLNSPPLAALHNLTEMKFPSSSSFLSQQDYQQTMKQMQMAMSSTPHGINDILSRPHSLLPRLGSAAGMYLSGPAGIRFPKLAELPGRPPIYWPGVMTEPWRPAPGQSAQHYGLCSTFFVLLLLHVQ